MNCVRCGKPAVHRHHRKLRSQGGDDSDANVIELCLDCHAWVHAKPEFAYESGFIVKSWEDPAEVVIRGVSQEKEHEHEGTCKLCGVELRRKPRKRFQGEAKRKRATISIKVPQDEQEDGAGIYQDALELAEIKLGYGDEPRPAYFTIIDSLLAVANGNID